MRKIQLYAKTVERHLQLRQNSRSMRTAFTKDQEISSVIGQLVSRPSLTIASLKGTRYQDVGNPTNKRLIWTTTIWITLVRNTSWRTVATNLSNAGRSTAEKHSSIYLVSSVTSWSTMVKNHTSVINQGVENPSDKRIIWTSISWLTLVRNLFSALSVEKVFVKSAPLKGTHFHTVVSKHTNAARSIVGKHTRIHLVFGNTSWHTKNNTSAPNQDVKNLS